MLLPLMLRNIMLAILFLFSICNIGLPGLNVYDRYLNVNYPQPTPADGSDHLKLVHPGCPF